MRFTRITLVFISCIIALGFYLLARHFLREVEPSTFQAAEETMVDTANLLAEMVGPALEDGTFDAAEFGRVFERLRLRRLEARIFNHVKREVALNVHLTDSRGVVVFSSDGRCPVGEDLTKWADVRQTLDGKYGARSTRLDRHDPMSSIMFVAAPVGDPAAPLGVLTVAKAQRDLWAFVTEQQRIILLACGLIGGGILVLIAAVFLWLFRPIGRLTAYARAVGEGGRPAMPRLGAGREVNTLAKALDSMREALEGRQYAGRYIRTLTHEMKSPLAAIRGAAELLDEEMPVEVRRRFLENIRAETARTERLISRLLELSAIESLERLESNATVDLAGILERALEQAAPLAELAGVSLRRASGGDGLTVRGDAFILRAAVTNLLENAIDFSPRGSGVELALEKRGEQVEINVRDHGPGIPDYARERVFERFYSLRHHTAGRKGTGLGLTLVKEAAELHGGTIALEDAPEGGTIARLSLPGRRMQ